MTKETFGSFTGLDPANMTPDVQNGELMKAATTAGVNAAEPIDAENGWANVNLKTALNWLIDSIATFAQATSSSTGACAQYYYKSNGTDTKGQIKATAGRLYALSMINTSASVAYVRIYNSSTSGGPASTETPVKKYTVPAGQTVIAHPPSMGSYFSAGIAWRITTGAADDDNVAVASNAISVNADFA